MSTGTLMPWASTSSNKLLARLPDQEYRRLLPDLRTITVRSGRVLLTPHVASREIYFLGGGVCSISNTTADGQIAGVAIVGNEGVVGMSAFGGDPESGERAVVEIADGEVQVMDVKVFRREMQRHGPFNDVIHHYAQAFVEILMQSVACNVLHSIEKRCARCLLDIRDRLGRNELPLTQDTLAGLLGVRRASVTLAVGAFEGNGLIYRSHKRIAIRDPVGLEAISCECYAISKRHLARLLA